MALVNSSMAEYVTKDLKLLGLNDRDAAIRDTRKFSVISVEGYDTSLQNYATRLTLRKHFASCGNILTISVFKSVALMRFEGKGAQDKALQLSGTDVGGWTAIVKAAPCFSWQTKPYDPCAPIIKEWSFFARGYDTGLPEIDIQIALCKHFSSCGEVTCVVVFSSGRAQIHIKGEGCVEKALELSGRQVGEINIVVELPPPMQQHPESPKNGKRKKMSYRLPVGYTPLEVKLEFANKKKEKNKKKKEKKKMKKEKKNENENEKNQKEKEMKMMEK